MICGLKYDFPRGDEHLSFFHSLCRLVLFLIRVVVRILAVDFAGVSLTFNAVVVGVLRTGEGSVEWSTFHHDKRHWNLRLTRTDCWMKLDLSEAILEPIVAQRRSILVVNCLENYLENIYGYVSSLKKLKKKEVCLPMRLGETGADRGIPNGVLNPWLPRCRLFR